MCSLEDPLNKVSTYAQGRRSTKVTQAIDSIRQGILYCHLFPFSPRADRCMTKDRGPVDGAEDPVKIDRTRGVDDGITTVKQQETTE